MTRGVSGPWDDDSMTITDVPASVAAAADASRGRHRARTRSRCRGSRRRLFLLPALDASPAAVHTILVNARVRTAPGGLSRLRGK